MMVGERNRPAFLDTPEGVAAVKASKALPDSIEGLTQLVKDKTK